MNLLVGKTAIVVGGGRGFGRSIALALAEEGADVAVAARTSGEIEKVAEEVAAKGRRGLAVKVDATDSEQVDQMVLKAVDRFGRIDILVNSQGEALIKPVLETTAEELDKLFQVNLRSVFLTCQAVVPYMLRQGGGHIFNVATRVGVGGAASVVAYTATKAGVIGLSKALALELRPHNIKVCVVCPSPMDTPMRWKATPEMDRAKVIRPEEIAGLIALLASMPNVYLEDAVIPTSVNS